MRSNGYSTPVPRRENELKDSRPGEVVKYQLSDEELAKYRALPIPNRSDKKPIDLRLATRELENQRTGNKKFKLWEENGMVAVKEGPDCGLTKEILIEQVAKGETLSSIERAWGMKYNTIHNWVKKWDLKGINQARAQQLLDRQPVAPKLLREKTDLPSAAVKAEVYQQTTDMLQKEKHALQEEIKKLRQANTDIKAECERLLQECEDYKSAAEDMEELTAERLKQLEKEKGDLLLRLSFLEVDRNQEPSEDTVPGAAPVDYVNHPPHYTRGGIECIQAIEAATVGLEGPEAYSTGAAIKYLWRWKWKNGTEDLQKARWYIDRLIALAVEA